MLRLGTCLLLTLTACVPEPSTAVDTAPDGGLPEEVEEEVTCAVPAIGDWVGTAQRREDGSGSYHDVSADVHWKLVRTDACVDHLVPTGTVSYEFATQCAISFEPASAAITATDGELVIDRRAYPATFRVVGATHWSATERCDDTISEREIGGTWIDAWGWLDGAVIDGVVRSAAELLPEATMAWHLRPVTRVEPPVSGCVELARDTWMFGGSVTGNATAAVTWTRVATDGCRDTFAPSGTARVEPVATPTCTTLTVTPAAAAITPEHGTLTIDRGTSPPTFAVSGRTTWPATVACTHADGTTDAYDADVGGAWALFEGAYGGDHFGGATALHAWRYAWRFGDTVIAE